MKVRIKRLSPSAVVPCKATPLSAGFDLFAPCDVELENGRQVVPLFFSIELPHGYAATIQPRSGFSSKGIECEYYVKTEEGGDVLVNGSYRLDADVIRGLVDEDYRGGVGVIVRVNRYIGWNERFVLRKGTRFAQMQIVEVPDVEFEETESLSFTERGGGGFGHSGS